MNSSNEAEGEIYIDDGRSYEFLEGAYIHRKFVFSRGYLTSSSLGPKSNHKKTFKTPCLVERIIILGLNAKDILRSKEALVEPSNRRVELESGPLLLRSGAPITSAHVIRKPNVPIAEDWSIKII